MKYKNGVYSEVVVWKDGEKKHLKFSPEITAAMETADALSKTIAKKEMVVTAGFDGKHMAGSKHYEGNAFDMRLWIYTDYELHTLLANLRENLGPDYDVLDEASHIHVEYDPKKKLNNETKIKTIVEVAEWEENEHRNGSNVDSTSHSGFRSKFDAGGTNGVFANIGSTNWRFRTRPQSRQNQTHTAVFKNKTEREVNSLVKTRLKINIAINKIVEFIKKITSWKTQRKRW